MKISDDKPTQDLTNYIKKTLDQRKIIHLAANNLKNEKIAEEKVGLSRKANDLNRIREIIRKTPDIREGRIAILREKIASGNYNVSGQEISDKMLREHLLEDVLRS